MESTPEAKAGDEPTVQEVSDYAEYLGLRPGEDGELLWIAEQALLAPLPEGWKEIEGSGGQTTYLRGNVLLAVYVDDGCAGGPRDERRTTASVASTAR